MVATVAVQAIANTRASAQVVPGAGAGIGTVAADRARIQQVLGDAPQSATDSVMTPAVHSLGPVVDLVGNSKIAAGGNDGALWAGRGASTSVTFGVAAARDFRGFLAEATLAPTVTYAQNRPFYVPRGIDAERSAFSSPWHWGWQSADLPLRFGDRAYRTIGPGQTRLTVSRANVAGGFATDNEWWGPSIRNTLVLSNNAAGIPRLFLKTAHPIETRLGTLEGRIFDGALTESPYFDTNAGNDIRAASGMLIVFHPHADSGLTLGASRLVVAPGGNVGGVLAHAFDALTRWEPVGPAGDTVSDGQLRQRTDQISSVFARWILPADGLEIYGELARTELPRSLREYLEAPQSTQAYTIGAQLIPRQLHARVRLQAEVSYLEQTTVWPDRPAMDYYTGRAEVQGFTQRGQVLGAAIGPGASSQFAAADWLSRAWQVGVFAGRTRTENDALYRQPNQIDTQHDVTVYAGARAGRQREHLDIAAELTAARRLNYLFQNESALGSPLVAVDITNVTAAVHLSWH